MKNQTVAGRLITLLPFFCAVAFLGCTSNKTSSDPGQTLSSIVTKNTACGLKTITDSCYSHLFKEKNAETGVRAILSKGNFYINTFSIPVTPGDYSVNGTKWITFSSAKDKWLVEGKEYDTYADASLAAVKKIPAGLEMRIYDKDNDGYADAIYAYYLEALIADNVELNDDGSYSITRLYTQDYAGLTEAEGKTYEGVLFSKGTGQRIPADNFDEDIQPGDLVLVFYSHDGWVAAKAKEIKGHLIEGIEKEYYQIEKRKYEDACGFSRNNLIISNRCGEFAKAMTFFGFTGADSKYEVSLWMVPTMAMGLYGAPAGFTTDALTARSMLANAISQTEIKSSDWTKKLSKSEKRGAQYTELKEVIANAKKVLDSRAPADMMNYEVYLLYLALTGTEENETASSCGYSFDAILK